jgi:hypothetical protein
MPRYRPPLTPKHPARFSPSIVDNAIAYLVSIGFTGRVLDPFAGTGERLKSTRGIQFYGAELQYHWAKQRDRDNISMVVANTLRGLPFAYDSFDGIFTSPDYGNRYADHHNAQDPSLRRSYFHDHLAGTGEPLHPDNGGLLHWGPAYRQHKRKSYIILLKYLKLDGLVLVNVSDIVRNKRVVPCVAWHDLQLRALGVKMERRIEVETPRMRMGANSKARVSHEVILVGRKRNG